MTNIDDRNDGTRRPKELPEPESLKRRGRGRFLKRAVVFMGLFYAAWCATLYFYQDRLLFPRDLAPEPLKLKYNRSTVEIKLDTDEGPVVAWFVPAPGLRAGERAPTAVCFHGNACIIDYEDVIVQGYEALGCNVLLPEYRGYGRSAGTPSEKAIVADAVRFYDELLKRPEVDPGRVFFHGRSLGGGPAARLALERKPAALILECTFTSAAAMAGKYWAPEFLARHPFRVDEALGRLEVPSLIMHGLTDAIVPISHGRKLAEIAKKGTYREYPYGHDDLPMGANEDRYWQDVEDFLAAARIIGKPAK